MKKEKSGCWFTMRRRKTVVILGSLLAMTVSVIPPALAQEQPSPATITLELANPQPQGHVWMVGDSMSFDVHVTNNSEMQKVFVPTASNLENFAACQLAINAHDTGVCSNRMTHILTADDVTNGGFTPTITYTMKESTESSESVALPTAQGNTTVIDVDSYSEATIVPTQPKEVWNVGDRINYTVAFRQFTGITRGMRPAESNLTNIDTCRSMRTSATWIQCIGHAYHIVTEDDLTHGGFAPYVRYALYRSENYNGTTTPTNLTEGSSAPVKPIVVNFVEMTQKQRGGEAQSKYAVGDTLSFDIRYEATETSNPRSVTFKPDDSTFTEEELATCRGQLADNENKTCTVTHALTTVDLESGTFVPSLMMEVRVDGELFQQAKIASTPVSVPGTWDEATAGSYANADPSLPAERGEDQVLSVGNTPAGMYYRIPSLTKAPNGDLLAAYDRRPGSAADSPNPNSIVQRRSTDGGKTWGVQTVISQGQSGAQKKGYSDPSYVVDYETGKIFSFHVLSYDNGFWQGNYRLTQGVIAENDRTAMHLHVAESTDNGHTWTSRDLTNMAIRDHVGTLKSGFATSGNGLQIQHGQYKGRLVQPYAFQLTPAAGSTIHAAALYSDDHGQTWQLGNLARVAQGVNRNFDETKMVELSDGSLMINSRSPGGNRLIATSHDGGLTWTPATLETQLTDPVNNATIIRAFPTATEGTAKSKVLLFSNTFNARARTNGSLSVSCDNGSTWLDENRREYRSGYTGYTSIAIQPDGRIGILYEMDGNGIGYTNVTLNWVREGICDLPTLTLASIADKTMIEGTPIDAIPLEVAGGDEKANRVVEVSGLPEGLSFDQETMAISGTPTHLVENAEVQVSVTDKDGTNTPARATTSFRMSVLQQAALTGPEKPVSVAEKAVALTGSHFAPNEEVTLRHDEAIVTENDTVVADENGEIRFTVDIAEGAQTGTHTVTATGAVSSKNASFDLRVVPQTTLRRAEGANLSVKPGAELTLKTSGFEPREAVNLTHEAPVSLASVVIPLFRSVGTPTDAFEGRNGFTALANSEGVAEFRLRVNSDAHPGDYEFTATGATSERAANLTLTIETPPVEETPDPSTEETTSEGTSAPAVGDSSSDGPSGPAAGNESASEGPTGPVAGESSSDGASDSAGSTSGAEETTTPTGDTTVVPLPPHKSEEVEQTDSNTTKQNDSQSITTQTRIKGKRNLARTGASLGILFLAALGCAGIGVVIKRKENA
ncbi:sialidase family protein [Schaalia sp. lx-260]|uniref:sialidase family protein n=1 Tax=Schaalia sp. lx-260 TaxID=2899082 RepID=UPI001E442938|nr:sialidase family protein [Schaalia sp. lx-260]MCD4549596.1 glycoside hydrolase [Schaalia sp. lx-260]